MAHNKPESRVPSQIVDLIIRLAVVLVLVIWSFQILTPFIMPVVWGVILSVASFPAYQILLKRLGERKKLAAALVSFLLLLVILVPCLLLAESLVTGLSAARESWREGMLEIPPPTEQVKEWPLIGEKAYVFWELASHNLSEALKPLAPHLETWGGRLLGALAGAGFAVLQFIFSIIISGILLASSEKAQRGASAFFMRLAPRRAQELLSVAELTVKNVARGILGVAFIQATLAGIGFAVAGIPGAGLWALVGLVLGIIQIGVGPVMIIGCIYMFSTASVLAASLFLVWTIIVLPLDNILKPLLLGKGAPVPMLIIFLGALGGFIKSGIIGLFVGAVILSLTYKLFVVWLEVDQEEQAEGNPA